MDAQGKAQPPRGSVTSPLWRSLRDHRTRRSGESPSLTAPAPPASGTVGAPWLWCLVGVVVLATLAPAVLLDHDSRVSLAKLAAISLLAAIPGWLYLQFIANRGYSLYDEYVLSLFRLHVDEYANLPAPPQHTSYYRPWKAAHDRLGTRSTDNLYRRKFEAHYGPASVSTRSLFTDHTGLRARTEGISPVLLATGMFALGWTMLLEPEVFRSFRLLPEAMAASGVDVPAQPLQYGFFGAYAFVVGDLVRRYFRDDLRASAYVAAVARVVFVTALVAALALLWPAELTTQQAAFAFLVGMFPQAGLHALRALVARPLRQLLPSFGSDQPLSRLQGLNVWYEARLMEEGVEDMQNLASAAFPDLLLRTRVPLLRLVDWVDQACLHLHLPADRGPHAKVATAFRTLGVRTATDLQRLWAHDEQRPALVAALARALDYDDGAAAAAGAAIVASLDGEPNLWHVAWFKDRHRRTFTLDEVGVTVQTGGPAAPAPPAPPPGRRDVSVGSGAR